jgi:hypothetical protein
MVLALGPVAAASGQPVGWQKYVVPETGANIDFPNEIFSQDAGRPQQGYGRRFQTADGRANLTVTSIPNAENDTPASFLRKRFRLPLSAAVYRRVTDNFFAVSGFHDNNIWYDRCNFARPFIHCVLLNYPAPEKRQWDYVVTQISNTLASRRTPRLHQGPAS